MQTINKSLNKKAMSEVLVTLVLVSLAISSVALVGYNLMSIFASTGNEIQQAPIYDCLSMENNPPITMTKACYNPSTKEAEITIARSALTNVQFISAITFSIDNDFWQCAESCGDCTILDKGEVRTYYFSHDEKPDSIEILLGSCQIAEAIIKDC